MMRSIKYGMGIYEYEYKDSKVLGQKLYALL